MLKVKRRPERTADQSGVTIIAHGSRCEADMALQGKMHIDGFFSGRLELEGHLSIGRQGRVEGCVHGTDVTISGEFDGDLVCQTLHLLKGARVSGRVACELLEQDPRAVFEAQHVEPETLAAPALCRPDIEITSEESLHV